MSYKGSWKIDDVFTFYANTTRFDTGAATDADSVPSYRVYEDETSTPILTGSMALLDSANTAGFYSEQITLSAANGFEKGKSYAIYIQATVNGVTGATHHTLQIEAEVDANIVSDKTGYALTAGQVTTIQTGLATVASIAALNNLSSAQVVTAIFAGLMEGRSFEEILKDIWAQTTGDAVADNATTPTLIVYEGPDGTTQVTHTITPTTRVKS